MATQKDEDGDECIIPTKMWQETYLEFQSNPMDHRNDKEFCKEIKLNYNILTTWKRNNRDTIYREVNRRRKSYIGEIRAIVMKKLMKTVADEDVNAIKLALTSIGDLVEKQEIRAEHMSHADKVKRIQDLLSNVRTKEASWRLSGSVPGDGDKPGQDQLGGAKPESGVVSDGSDEPKPGEDASTGGKP